MTWASWEATWRVHARSDGYKRRVATAIEVAERAYERLRQQLGHAPKLYVSLSGGKDSAALAGIVEQAGLADHVPCVHASTPLDLTDTLPTVEAICERLDLELDIVEPSGAEEHIERIRRKYKLTSQPIEALSREPDAWDVLRAIPGDVTANIDDLYAYCGAGNLLVAYTYEQGLDGAYIGRRAEESRARQALSLFHATIGKARTKTFADGTCTIDPLLAWTGDDVFAYLQERNIPLHPYYRRAYEASGGSGRERPTQLRVDIAIAGEAIVSRGSLRHVALVYPEHWARLVKARPELARYV